MRPLRPNRISPAKLAEDYVVLDSGLYQGAVLYSGDMVGGTEVTHFFTSTDDYGEKVWVKAIKK